MKDSFKLLGVDCNVSTSELKKRYSKFAKKYHPDKKHGNAVKFRLLNNAYKEIKIYINSRDAEYSQLKTASKDASFFPEKNPINDLHDFDIAKFNSMFEATHVDNHEAPELQKDPPAMPTSIQGDVAAAYAKFVEEHAPQSCTGALITFPDTLQTSAQLSHELGVTKVDDYSNYACSDLMMTDYRKGYGMQKVYSCSDSTQQVTMANAEQHRRHSLEMAPTEKRAYDAHLSKLESNNHHARNNQEEMDHHALARFNRMMYTISNRNAQH